MPEPSTFTGFTPAAVAFYAGLLADNSKQYWDANKPVFEAEVRLPMLALVEALDEEFQPLKVFRPYRDVRFARDKSPYKTQLGAFGEGQGGSGYYLHLSAGGMFVACGYHHLAADQLARYRDAVAGEEGVRLPKIIEAVRSAGLEVGGGLEPSLKRAPRGYPPDHPRVDLLRLKGATASAELGDPPWLATPRVVDEVQRTWRAAAPLLAWLDLNVGPSRELPPEARAFLG